LSADVVKAVGELPWQIVEAEGEGVEGTPTFGVTTTVPEAHVVMLQLPAALTKYTVEDPAGGVTVIEGPVPAEVPPHEPVNHSHVAPVPRVPPLTVRVFEVVLQVLLPEIFTPDGAVDTDPTDTERVLEPLVPQLFPAVTDIVPFWPVLPAVTLILFVPLPFVIDQPAGRVQE
jgi:hypothetical protein